MRTIGVLGGIGPQATMAFEAHAHAAARRLLPPRGNGDYPPMVAYYLRQPPVAVGDDALPIMPLRPPEGLLAAARALGTLADFLVVTSNGAHAMRAAIEGAAGRPLLSMIDLALEAVHERDWRRVGVLGLGEPHVYLAPLAERGLAAETLDAEARAPLDEAIFRMMEGRAGAAERAAAEGAVAALRGRRGDGVILGCIEIPLLLGEASGAPDLLDPAPLLAEAAVRHALDGGTAEMAEDRPGEAGRPGALAR